MEESGSGNGAANGASLRPNIAALMRLGDDDSDGDNTGSAEEDGGEKMGGVYRPPKTLAVPYMVSAGATEGVFFLWLALCDILCDIVL